jgi:uncharacterized protein YnzC (UPF0291/DUF896 family)
MRKRALGVSWRNRLSNTAKREAKRTRRTYAPAIRTRVAAEKAYHSIVDPLEQDVAGQLKAALRSDENSREIAQRFGLVDF